MAAYDNSHSWLVAGAKIALPLAALALLSTLFLLAERVDPTAAIPYARINVEELAREQRVTAPQFAGMTEDGAALSITAETARPDPDGGSGASAAKLLAHMETAGGLVADLFSLSGRIDPSAGHVILSDGVRIETSTGYLLTTQRLEARTDRSEMIAPGPVQAQSPLGRIEAGSMALISNDGGVTHQLVFKDGVKLIYQPEK
ncbi:hypothetical protein [Pontitalea aquivivens]|uniref:hypothetical protein n=1 Tax=Pontitalea aquivivens TaxID=3388663 RepID=UPI003970CAD5